MFRKSQCCYLCGKLTWLALGEDHAALSRRVEQLTALLRFVKPWRCPMGTLAAQFLTTVARVRAATNLRAYMRLFNLDVHVRLKVETDTKLETDTEPETDTKLFRDGHETDTRRTRNLRLGGFRGWLSRMIRQR
jgi:hypothetical protein